jgi:hypothetical protein
MSTMGNRSLQEVLRATYSASMVDRAISVWSLDFHKTGQLKTVMRNPVRLQAQWGSWESSWHTSQWSQHQGSRWYKDHHWGTWRDPYPWFPWDNDQCR